MLEEAVEKQEAAEAEAAAHFKDGAKLAEENEKLRGEIGALTEKLEANEKALDEMTALYKSANHSAAILRSRIDEEKALRDQALEAHGEDMKALEKLHRRVAAVSSLLPVIADESERTAEAIRRFAEILLAAGVVATTRKTRGDDIDAACGQLAGQVQDKTRRTASRTVHFHEVRS